MRGLKKIEVNKTEIDQLVAQCIPIDQIAKQFGIARDTLRKAYPGYKGRQGYGGNKVDNILNETRICVRCGKKFKVTGTTKSYALTKRQTCGSECSHSRDMSYRWKEKGYSGGANYRKVCNYFHERKCVVCGEEKIIDVHHYDKDRKNNKPENLIPLCPTHHRYVHSEYVDEVLPQIKNYRKQFIDPDCLHHLSK